MSKILIYDIETTPNLAYVWGKYQQDVIAFESEWSLLSFSYKWLGDKKTHVYGANQYSEQELVELLHNLFDESDVVIAHNGDKFDQRMVNAKFLEFGFMPPAPYRSIDTLKVARKYFRLNSNKLDDIARLLGIGQKLDTGGFETWLGCMQNDRKSWSTMLKYNKQDVILLEKVYLRLRPWIENHPAVNVLDDRPDGCPKCGDTRMQSRGTRKSTKVGIYRRFQCMGCGGWSQARQSEKTLVKYTN